MVDPISSLIKALSSSPLRGHGEDALYSFLVHLEPNRSWSVFAGYCTPAPPAKKRPSRKVGQRESSIRKKSEELVMQPWKTRSRTVVLDGGKFLTVERHEVELPDGRIIPDWHWVITPDYVNIIAVTESGQFLCFRQTKYAVEGTSLSAPGGYLEPNEDPLEAAKRELLEETGYAAPQWTSLGTYSVDGNRGAGRAHLFLAQGAYPTRPIDADDLEQQELLHLTRTELKKALTSGEFKVLAWAANVALALFHINQKLPSGKS